MLVPTGLFSPMLGVGLEEDCEDTFEELVGGVGVDEVPGVVEVPGEGFKAGGSASKDKTQRS